METNNIYVVYRRALNWTEGKIQQHLLARENNHRIMLGLSLALLSHRLPFYGSNLTVLEDPIELSDYVIKNSLYGNDQDKAKVVEILCEISKLHIEQGLEKDSEPIKLLVQTSAIILLEFESQSMLLASTINILGQLMKKRLSLDELNVLSNKYKAKNCS